MACIFLLTKICSPCILIITSRDQAALTEDAEMTDLSAFVMFGAMPDPAVVAALCAAPRVQNRPYHPELMADEVTETEVQITDHGWLDLRIYWSADWTHIYGEYRFIAGELDGVLLTRDQTAALVGDAWLTRWAESAE